ncbi:alkaline phosphatase [Silanimonas sp.]|uniref:alkaline phosphatase n=1 Tax=Silanimonas sp. TaxID=1929290 RepID=UPI001BBF204A|nr:alkaline phosphatase [Silanimonas sp.]MBS3895820.1 alkaline phosphatase [Silanimonas sp.]MBS3924217.1 alkaline phosphatase [Xanthomonadaceae bacterium]
MPAFRPLAAALAASLLLIPALAASANPRSAIFLHPDGMGANTWSATRLLHVGPDGRLAWDQLPEVAIYVGPSLDAVEQSSNGGATTHAYGVRARLDSFGQIDGQVPVAASGQRLSLMREAQAAGKKVAIFNSSSLTEPGTAVFLASVTDGDDETEIAAQILAARPDIALGGGERFFLPRGVRGRHGMGARRDGRNLIEEARAAGYTVVFTAAELAALPAGSTRVLGLFAAEETFNQADEAGLAAARLPAFQPQAPRFDTMLAFILPRLKDHPQGYFIVGNEEGTDNFSGENNASAALEAAIGADRAIALALAEAQANPALTVVVASDSDNGGMNPTSDDLGDPATPPRRLPRRTSFGSPIDGDPSGRPFLAAADRFGVRLPFYVSWASDSDGAGGTVVRGIGPGATMLKGTVDATEIYTALHRGLFGAESPEP